jgi:hypothetical protein
LNIPSKRSGGRIHYYCTHQTPSDPRGHSCDSPLCWGRWVENALSCAHATPWAHAARLAHSSKWRLWGGPAKNADPCTHPAHKAVSGVETVGRACKECRPMRPPGPQGRLRGRDCGEGPQRMQTHAPTRPTRPSPG